jgi:hypothetical protein
MTLTLPETIQAIQDLDTEEDIIVQACQRIASDATGRKRNLASRKIAEFIIDDYEDRADMGEVMIACCLVAGRIAAIMCRIGEEQKIVKGLKAVMLEEFTHTRLKRIVRKEMESD